MNPFFFNFSQKTAYMLESSISTSRRPNFNFLAWFWPQNCKKCLQHVLDMMIIRTYSWYEAMVKPTKKLFSSGKVFCRELTHEFSGRLTVEMSISGNWDANTKPIPKFRLPIDISSWQYVLDHWVWPAVGTWKKIDVHEVFLSSFLFLLSSMLRNICAI